MGMTFECTFRAHHLLRCALTSSVPFKGITFHALGDVNELPMGYLVVRKEEPAYRNPPFLRCFGLASMWKGNFDSFEFLFQISKGAVGGIPAARRAKARISSLGSSNVDKLWGRIARVQFASLSNDGWKTKPIFSLKLLMIKGV